MDELQKSIRKKRIAYALLCLLGAGLFFVFALRTVVEAQSFYIAAMVLGFVAVYTASGKPGYRFVALCLPLLLILPAFTAFGVGLFQVVFGYSALPLSLLVSNVAPTLAAGGVLLCLALSFRQEIPYRSSHDQVKAGG